MNLQYLAGRALFYICWPGLYLYFRFSQRSRVLIIRGDKALLVKGWWSRVFADGSWGLPGGGLHRNESAVLGACRELHEELGIIFDSTALLLLGSQTVIESGIRYQGLFYLIRLDDDVALRLNHEIVSAEWTDFVDTKKRHKPEVEIAQRLLADL